MSDVTRAEADGMTRMSIQTVLRAMKIELPMELVGDVRHALLAADLHVSEVFSDAAAMQPKRRKFFRVLREQRGWTIGGIEGMLRVDLRGEGLR